jgi:hypothetical protein
MRKIISRICDDRKFPSAKRRCRFLASEHYICVMCVWTSLILFQQACGNTVFAAIGVPPQANNSISLVVHIVKGVGTYPTQQLSKQNHLELLQVSGHGVAFTPSYLRFCRFRTGTEVTPFSVKGTEEKRGN